MTLLKIVSVHQQAKMDYNYVNGKDPMDASQMFIENETLPVSGGKYIHFIASLMSSIWQLSLICTQCKTIVIFDVW